jgi:hypothetical protein
MSPTHSGTARDSHSQADAVSALDDASAGIEPDSHDHSD